MEQCNNRSCPDFEHQAKSNCLHLVDISECIYRKDRKCRKCEKRESKLSEALAENERLIKQLDKMNRAIMEAIEKDGDFKLPPPKSITTYKYVKNNQQKEG